MKINVPPIKSQGIKTKLIPWIRSVMPKNFDGFWIEPFMGTGAVGFNIASSHALLCDTNPHLVNFYQSVVDGYITPQAVRDFLNKEGEKLLEKGESHYYQIRERFNKEHHPLDFLFLNRAGYNGMIRFNRKGEFNIPFCRKPQRFAQAYVTKIVNQVAYAGHLLKTKKFIFKCQDFQKTIAEAGAEDIIYCDPPYIDRHVDYYNGWSAEHEISLCQALSQTASRFVLSTWHHNDFRKNKYIESLWGNFNVLTRKHFYHVGAKEKNRNPMVEAIVTNCNISDYEYTEQQRQLMLLEGRPIYEVR